MKIHNPQGEVRELVLEMMSKVAEWRGVILDKAIFLERTIDFYLAYKFCDNEPSANEMVELIFATHKMGWRAKKDLLISLVDKYDPEFKSENPTFVNDLDHCFAVRNRFAHQMLDTSFGNPNSGVDLYKNTRKIGLLIFQNQKTPVSYSKSDIENEVNKLVKLMDIFRQLLNKSMKTSSSPISQ